MLLGLTVVLMTKQEIAVMLLAIISLFVRSIDLTVLDIESFIFIHKEEK